MLRPLGSRASPRPAGSAGAAPPACSAPPPDAAGVDGGGLLTGRSGIRGLPRVPTEGQAYTPPPYPPSPPPHTHTGLAALRFRLRASEGPRGVLSVPSGPRHPQPVPGPGPGRPDRLGRSHGEPAAPPRASSSRPPPPFLTPPSLWPLAPRPRPASRPISGPFAGYRSPLLTQGGEREDERRPEREAERGGDRQTGSVGTESQTAVSRLWASRGGVLAPVVHGHQL